MAEGGKRPTSFNVSFRKTSSEYDESISSTATSESDESTSRTSSDSDELLCDLCRSEDKWMLAEGYCEVCNEYLCEACLREHNYSNTARAHVILDKSQMPRRHGLKSSKTERPESMRFFRATKYESGCGDCLLHHAICRKKRVAKSPNAFKKTKEFKDIAEKLQQLPKELQKVEGLLESNLKNLNSTYINILRKIDSVRGKINAYLDEIEDQIKDEAAQMKKEDEKELKTLRTENKAMKAEVKVMLQALHDNNLNMNIIFGIHKRAKQRTNTLGKEINRIKLAQSQQQQYFFLLSSEIQKLMSAKTPFGKLSRKTAHQIRLITEEQYERTPKTPIIDAAATYRGTFNVKGETDARNCWITDCTLLSEDRMVIIDVYNKNVKLVNTNSCTVIATYSISNYQSKVTALSTNMIAMTMPGESKIQVLSVTTTFTVERQFKTKHACYGIAYKDGKFAVSYVGPGKLEILDKEGKVLHLMQPKQGRDYMYVLQGPSNIIFGQDEETVIVSDNRTNKVVVVTFSGRVSRIYTHDTLEYPRGIAITEDGVLFVCSWENGCIYVVSPDFKSCKPIINNDGHVVNPGSISYCEINRRLYISNTYINDGDIYNQIQVYDFNINKDTMCL